ncbi:MAG: hypothetical protein V7603_3520 [Micromonosporaceae bacterium]
MRVRLLGTVDVLVEATAREVPGLRRKAVLAALALQPGEIVSTDRLADVVWGDNPPANTLATLHNHVSRLRTILGRRAAIVGRAPGYLLDLGENATDVQAARGMIQQATAAGDLHEREDRLRAAVALWRGPPLADLAALVWFDDHARRLEQLWLQARLDLIDTQLALGQHSRLVAELQELAGQHSFNEQIHGQLMLALYRTGRQSEALAAFQRLQQALQDQLGIDPSPHLRDRHTAILRQDPTLDPPASAPLAAGRPAAMSMTTPAHLPTAPGGFTGRSRELAHLHSLLPAVRGGAAPAVAVLICAISGTAGVGKTALAVHWAHQVSHLFPDGQLYVNLRGFDPSGQALDTGTALRGFLDALGVPADRMPPDLDAQVGRYRSLLAGKRILVVLDNARDSEQVRPLLPAAPGCVAVITSRHELTSLTALDNAQPVVLNLLSTVDAYQLLARRLGARRLTAEPDAVGEIIARCAGLPLALVITAARAAVRPTFPLATLAAELGDAAAALDGLRGHDPATDLRAVFSWSYQTLSPDAGRLFRLLGLHAGPDISTAAAASLAAIAPDRASRLLTELAGVHLATEHSPDRFTSHDLLRAYAIEQAHRHDSAQDRHAARHRLLDHYLHTAHRGRMLLNPHRQPITPAAHQPGVTPEHPTDRDHALGWFTIEYHVLLAATEQAAASGFDNHAWQLAWALRTFSNRQGLWQEQIATDHTAQAAARRLGDRFAQARSCFGLATSYLRSGRLDQADAYYRQALDLYTELGDLADRAETHSGLAGTAADQGRYADALTHAQQALDLLRAADDRGEYARVLNNLGWIHALLGNHRQALAYCTKALSLLQKLGNGPAEAAVWDSLGYAHRGLANYEQSITCYQRAIELYHNVGDRHNEADSQVNLGDAYQAAGHSAAAHAAWKCALDVLDQLNHPDAGRVRVKLGC